MAISRSSHLDHGIVSLQKERLSQVALFLSSYPALLLRLHRDSNFDVFSFSTYLLQSEGRHL